MLGALCSETRCLSLCVVSGRRGQPHSLTGLSRSLAGIWQKIAFGGVAGGGSAAAKVKKSCALVVESTAPLSVCYLLKTSLLFDTHNGSCSRCPDRDAAPCFTTLLFCCFGGGDVHSDPRPIVLYVFWTHGVLLCLSFWSIPKSQTECPRMGFRVNELNA